MNEVEMEIYLQPTICLLHSYNICVYSEQVPACTGKRALEPGLDNIIISKGENRLNNNVM